MTVVVPGNESAGNITVIIDNQTYTVVNVTNGTAIVNLTNVTPGEHNITVIYTDGNGTNSTVNDKITIKFADTPIKVNLTDIYVGDVARINVEVPNGATGKIRIQINSIEYFKDIDGGIARFEIENLTFGKKTVTVDYVGDTYYAANYTTAVLNISKNPAPFEISVEGADVGGKATVKVVNIPDDATGHVIVTLDDVEYGINITSVKSTVVFVVKGGLNQIVATYLGDDKFLSNVSTGSFNANKTDGHVIIEVENATTGQDVIVKVTVPEDATGNITVQVDNITKVVNVTGGENTIPISGLSEGPHNISVVYSGDETYKSASSNTTVYVVSSIAAEKKLTRAYNSEYDFEAEFLDKQAKLLENTEVKFIIDGKTYTAKTDVKGTAKLTISHLDVGTYDVTIINPVTGEEVVKKLSIVPRLTDNKDLTMDFLDGSYYSVRVIDDMGNPVGAGEVVRITVNGVHYARLTTDANGYATLKINLNPKTYKITVQYRAYKVTNTIKVKQTFKLVKKTVTVKKGKKDCP